MDGDEWNLQSVLFLQYFSAPSKKNCHFFFSKREYNEKGTLNILEDFSKGALMKKVLVLLSVLLLTAACNTGNVPSVPEIDMDALGTMVVLTTEAALTEAAPIITQIPPLPNNPTPVPTLTDEELIRQALLAKLGWADNELEFSVDENTGTVARGSLNFVGEMQGAAWFAGKDNAGNWVIAYIGQGVPDCSDVQPFNFPTTWISHCLDASGNTIEIGAPAPPTLTDEELIRQALLAKLGWADNELEFSIGENTGTLASGSLNKVGEMQGAAWFAGKDNAGNWVIAHIGQGIPECSDVQPFNFPTTWISHCLDASGNTIAR